MSRNPLTFHVISTLGIKKDKWIEWELKVKEGKLEKKYMINISVIKTA